MPGARVIDELVADSRGGITGSQGGRFFGWVIGGGLPAAMAADWLTTVWDQNAGVYAAGPAAAVVEEIAGAWLRELFELPFEASFAFTTGTQMAHGLVLPLHVTQCLPRMAGTLRGKVCSALRLSVCSCPLNGTGQLTGRHACWDLARRRSSRWLWMMGGRVQPETLASALSKGGRPGHRDPSKPVSSTLRPSIRSRRWRRSRMPLVPGCMSMARSVSGPRSVPRPGIW